MYGYAVSLGANMLTLYLVNEGSKTPLKGALSYGLPFNLEDNVPFFKRNLYKFYDFSMGYNFFLVIQSKLDEVRGYMAETEYNELTLKLFESRKSLMEIDIKCMIPSFEEYSSI